MSGDSLQVKQAKWQPMNAASKASQESPDDSNGKAAANRQLDDANQEWRRFYEIIKEITMDMRY
ncbi:hypothetical protein L1N85_08600 [Paenibacillus alkaliterrae]|uniref:hypothetical protein n=1 Tax=Paenibacillus alkaliterrae TaxID=320909 RepID=UPI001F3002E5|nr:hypothetical protein [Paenibacillus alkaliterrae]MCF2938492.1 hypothetical protein [Paenibacillus alkaliterrae]